MKAAFGVVLSVAGFVAAIVVPAGPPLLAAFAVLAIGAGLLADVWLDMCGEP